MVPHLHAWCWYAPLSTRRGRGRRRLSIGDQRARASDRKYCYSC